MSTDEASERIWMMGHAISQRGYCLETLGRKIRLALKDSTRASMRPLAARCREEAARISRELLEAATALGEPQDATEPKELPPAEDGQLIDCPRCGDKHMLTAVQQQGEPPFLVYACCGRTYLGGVNGRLVAGSLGGGS